jgi:hypothetical protein
MVPLAVEACWSRCGPPPGWWGTRRLSPAPSDGACSGSWNPTGAAVAAQIDAVAADRELADVLQVGYDEQAQRWWLCCPGCDRRRDLHDAAELTTAIPPFLELHEGCH